MYVVAEEESKNEGIGGNVVIVSSVWLTPRKLESFWPNSKFSAQYNKLLVKHEHPAEDWPLIQLRRKFFETGKYDRVIYVGNNVQQFLAPEIF